MKMKKIKSILTKQVDRLGMIGDMPELKPGFFRYLYNKGYAIKHNSQNIKKFEEEKEKLILENEKAKEYAITCSKELENVTGFPIIVMTSDGHKLYGSIKNKDVSKAINEKIERNLVKNSMIQIPDIREIGVYEGKVTFHPDVRVDIYISVASNQEEAYNMLNKRRNKLAAPQEATQRGNQKEQS